MGIKRPERATTCDGAPSNFDRDYVEHVIKPFLTEPVYQGDGPTAPMIDRKFDKENALPSYFWGMLYDEWRPDKKEGTSVFIEGYDKRGPHNERKKIYLSAVTPDLYRSEYREKVVSFFGKLLDSENQGKSFMRLYVDRYPELYWNLHVGLESDIPQDVIDVGKAFLEVLARLNPTTPTVYENYQKVRELRPRVIDWICEQVRCVRVSDDRKRTTTFVWHWVQNKGNSEHFDEKDIAFECFHNMLAFSQWGNTLYRIISYLSDDSEVQSWFRTTMESDGAGDCAAEMFPPLDRFVMELFRHISPNEGSVSRICPTPTSVNRGPALVVTPHREANMSSIHWSEPKKFDPNRYLGVHVADHALGEVAKQFGFTRPPFSENGGFRVDDGRNVEIRSSALGTAYATEGEHPFRVCEHAGYAPFGFGYRRCPGELLTVEVMKDFLRMVWNEKIEFKDLGRGREAECIPVAPRMLIPDTIGFTRTCGRDQTFPDS
jgi:cytochrome P450